MEGSEGIPAEENTAGHEDWISQVRDLQTRFAELETARDKERQEYEDAIQTMKQEHASDVERKDRACAQLRDQVTSLKIKYQEVRDINKQKAQQFNAKLKEAETFANSKIQEAEDKLLESRRTIEQLVVDNRSLGRAYAEIRQQLLEEKNGSLESKLALLDKTSEASQFKMEIQQLKQRLEEAEQLLETKEQEFTDAEVLYLDKVSQLEKDLAYAQSEIKQLTSKVELEVQEKNVTKLTMMKMQALMEQDMNTLANYHQNLQKNINTLTEENNRLKTEVEPKSPISNHHLHRAEPLVDVIRLTEQDNEISRLLEQIESFRSLLAEAESNSLLAKSQHESELFDLTCRSTNLLQQNQELTSQLATYQDELERLKGEPKREYPSQGENDGQMDTTPTPKVNTTQLAISALEGEILTLTSRLEHEKSNFAHEKDHLVKEKDTLREQILLLNSQVSRIHEELSSSIKQVQDLESSAATVEKYKEQNKALNLKVQELSKQLDDSKLEAEQTKVSLEKDIQLLHNIKGTLEQECSIYMQRLDDSSKKCKEYQLQAAEARQKMEETMKAFELDQLESSQLIETLEKMVTQLGDELKETEKENIKLLTDLEEAESRILDSKQDYLTQSQQRSLGKSDSRVADMIPTPEAFLHLTPEGNVDEAETKASAIAFVLLQKVKDAIAAISSLSQLVVGMNMRSTDISMLRSKLDDINRPLEAAAKTSPVDLPDQFTKELLGEVEALRRKLALSSIPSNSLLSASKSRIELNGKSVSEAPPQPPQPNEIAPFAVTVGPQATARRILNEGIADENQTANQRIAQNPKDFTTDLPPPPQFVTAQSRTITLPTSALSPQRQERYAGATTTASVAPNTQGAPSLPSSATAATNPTTNARPLQNGPYPTGASVPPAKQIAPPGLAPSSVSAGMTNTTGTTATTAAIPIGGFTGTHVNHPMQRQTHPFPYHPPGMYIATPRYAGSDAAPPMTHRGVPSSQTISPNHMILPGYHAGFPLAAQQAMQTATGAPHGLTQAPSFSSQGSSSSTFSNTSGYGGNNLQPQALYTNVPSPYAPISNPRQSMESTALQHPTQAKMQYASQQQGPQNQSSSSAAAAAAHQSVGNYVAQSRAIHNHHGQPISTGSGTRITPYQAYPSHYTYK
eukprot:TRINITY_DN7661_c0_g1_i2.p1 TRINITY_DN7661_c0_g1~~TRINITY_DN7661_c0_g1_i2.p1  ORF type:complete len:1142 (+),score=266.31 TRINITY_DN7661_c0_g1_i2:49-3474(+)